MTSRAYRTAAIITIVATHVLSAWYAWTALSGSWTWLDLGFGLLAGHLLLDFITLNIHWTLDNYFTARAPIIGGVIGFFREHHAQPNAMFGRDFFESNFENSLIGAVSLLVMLPLSFSPTTGFALAFAAFGSSYVTQIHKWAHVPPSGGIVAMLQRARLVVDPKLHERHHQDARRCYGLYAGWLDRIFDALRVFEIAEVLIFLTTGAVAVESRLRLAAPGEVSGARARVRRTAWRLWYAFLAAYARRRGARFSCMNWGYAEEAAGAEDASMSAHPERYPLQLYQELAAGALIENGTLVDVSCGRGGGIAHLHRRYRPARAIGIDLVDGNVAASRSAFTADGLEFRQGSAEAIPLSDGEASVVVSVEASHCYGDLARFLEEAHRVLAPGGRLLWTDFAPAGELALRRALAERWFRIVEERDITENVLLAMRLDADRRLELIRRHASPLLHGVLGHFAAAGENERSYRDFAEGRDVYFLLRLERLNPIPIPTAIPAASSRADGDSPSDDRGSRTTRGSQPPERPAAGTSP